MGKPGKLKTSYHSVAHDRTYTAQARETQKSRLFTRAVWNYLITALLIIRTYTARALHMCNLKTSHHSIAHNRPYSAQASIAQKTRMFTARAIWKHLVKALPLSQKTQFLSRDIWNFSDLFWIMFHLPQWNHLWKQWSSCNGAACRACWLWWTHWAGSWLYGEAVLQIGFGFPSWIWTTFSLGVSYACWADQMA